MVKIIIIGYGNVGKNLIRILSEQKEELQSRYNFTAENIANGELKGALINENGLDLTALVSISDYTQSKDWVPDKKSTDVIEELKADFMVECAWTNPETGEPALSHVISALKHGMNVVSSNKGPFYLKYKEIQNLARENNVFVGIESTVGSAIPCLSANETLAGTKITSIRAILNGTSNYILSRMTSENLSFDLALKEAQDLGYAEADPTLDIEGYDAAGKLVILANELLGWDKTIKDVDVKGITEITPQAIALARIDDYLIKHVGVAREGVFKVGLQLIPRHSPLAVNGTLNVIELNTQNAGPITFVGRGAGGHEAASGILSDIIRISTRLN